MKCFNCGNTINSNFSYFYIGYTHTWEHKVFYCKTCFQKQAPKELVKHLLLS